MNKQHIFNITNIDSIDFEIMEQLHEDEAIILGERMLYKALVAVSLPFEKIHTQIVDELLKQFNLKDLNALYLDISLGKRVASLVARQIADINEGIKNPQPLEDLGVKGIFNRYAPDWLKSSTTKYSNRPLAIRGTEGSVVTYAKCCHPIPGDPVLGFVSAGRGIVIHVRGCKNVREFKNSPERWVDVQWESNVEGVYPVDLIVDTANQRGVLATVASTFSDLDSNIENVAIEERDGRYSTMVFTISVRDRVHLAHILRRVKSIDSVIKVARTK